MVLERLLPKTIAVLPLARGSDSEAATTGKQADRSKQKTTTKDATDGGCFRLGEAVRLENRPNRVGGKSKIPVN